MLKNTINQHMFNYIFLGFLLTLSACANNPLSSYTSNITPPINALSTGNIDQAESALVVRQDLLYYLEHGTIYRMSGRYESSNTEFTAAQKYIDAWVESFHNGSLGVATDTMEASLINDKVLDYSAKDYEKVMLPTYKALNDITLGDMSSARVEITRMYNLEDTIQDYRDMLYAKAAADTDVNDSNTKFASFEQVESMNKNQYNFTAINTPQVLALKNSYQNAFSHYLAGFVFEALGEPSLARPGYIKAGQLNPDNQLIRQSIQNLDKPIVTDNTTTDLLLVEEVGHAPELKSVSFPVPFQTTQGQNTCANAITIAFPELVPEDRHYNVNGVDIDGKQYTPIMFTNFNLMAARYLHDNLPNIFLRNTIRAAKDLTLQQSVCSSSGGGIASLLATLGTEFLGQADERTWVMLPGQIYVTRIKLKRGMHIINVNSGYTSKQIKVNLTQNYAVLSWRMIGSGIYFNPESTM